MMATSVGKGIQIYKKSFMHTQPQIYGGRFYKEALQ